MPVAIGQVLDGAMKATGILKALSEILRQKSPDLEAAKIRLVELNQVVYELQSENLSLRQQLVQLEADKSALIQKIAPEDEWKNRSADVEIFQTAAGAVIYRRVGTTDMYFCPTCYEKRLLIPLQRGSGGYYICRLCQTSYHIEDQPVVVNALQPRQNRHPYR